MTKHSHSLPRATNLAHDWVAKHLPAGGNAIDATAGNGHDTVFLARTCGPDGSVHAFDIQATAVEQTRIRLTKAGAENVTVHQRCHSRMADILGASLSGKTHAVMFNLGYLPGGDKSRITQSEITVRAIDTALSLLAPGGIVTIVAYPGHPGGETEAAAVESFARRLNEVEWQVARYQFLNPSKRPPELVGIVRRGHFVTPPIPCKDLRGSP